MNEDMKTIKSLNIVVFEENDRKGGRGCDKTIKHTNN